MITRFYTNGVFQRAFLFIWFNNRTLEYTEAASLKTHPQQQFGDEPQGAVSIQRCRRISIRIPIMKIGQYMENPSVRKYGLHV